MKKATIALVGIGAGAGLMYLMDPDSGRRRRGRLRDIAVHTSKVVRTATEARAHDVENRASGLVARIRLRVRRAEVPIDDVLVERIRARLGHVVPHPREIEVHASKGAVTLSGGVSEVDAVRLLSFVPRIPGVITVEDRLDRFEHAGAAM